MDMNTAGQIFGMGLSVLGFVIYYAKTRRGILCAKLLSDFLSTFQQFMVGAPTGALINGLAIFREIVFYYRQDKKWASHRFWLYFFIVLMGITPVFTWMGPVSILPAAGSVLSVVAFYCVEPRHTRMIAIFSLLPWFLYCHIIPNYGILVSITIQITSAILGLIRDYKELKAKTNA